MIIGYILLELLLGAMILGFIGAYKKRLFDRIILLATVPLAFVMSIVGMKALLSANTLTMIIETIPGLAEEIGVIPEEGFGVIISVALPIVAMISFWLFLIVLRIIAGIVLAVVHTCSGCRAREREAKREYKEAKREGRDAKEEDEEKSIFKRYKKPLWHKLTTGAVGAVSGFLIVMLSTLPLVFVTNLAEPALETALTAENEGTYVNEIAKTIDENFMVLSDKTLFGKIQKFTGMRAITDAAVKSLTNVTVQFDGSESIEFNFTETAASLVSYGVDAAVAYERICGEGATMKSMSPISDILSKLANDEGLINSAFAIYSNTKGLLFGEEEAKNLPYDIESAEALRSDLNAAAGLVDIASTDLAHISLDSADLLGDILEYLEDEESAKKLVNVIGESNAFKTKFPDLMEYALALIADQLDLPKDKDEDYEMFIEDITEALNNKTFGTYDEAKVEYFIVYAADNGLNVEKYVVSNRAEPTELDVAYLNYIEFIERKNDIEEVFTDKLLDNSKNLSYYITSDGVIYVYSKSIFGWELYSDSAEVDLRQSSYAAMLLANEVNKLMKLDPKTAIDADDARELARAAALGISSADPEISSSTRLMLSVITSIKNYEPNDPVYRESIVNALNKDAVIDKEHNDAFGTSLTVMAKLYGSLTAESDEASVDTVMDNFHLVGRLLDSLKAMETTSAVPDKMLDAIMQNKNYGKFFAADAVQKTLQNIKDGKSTYEELFTTVQGVYGLASGIIPT